MRAELRYLHSPDALNLQNYIPEDPDCFCILVQAMIGPLDARGEESFDFLVCTPRWLETKALNDGYIFGRHYLVVSKYAYNLLLTAIENLCNRMLGTDWETIGNKLGRYGRWEFEDYIPG